jgi:hypothetical protein
MVDRGTVMMAATQPVGLIYVLGMDSQLGYRPESKEGSDMVRGTKTVSSLNGRFT